jgi:hypothetical protein
MKLETRDVDGALRRERRIIAVSRIDSVC